MVYMLDIQDEIFTSGFGDIPHLSQSTAVRAVSPSGPVHE